MGPRQRNPGNASHKGGNMDELRPASNISFFRTDSSHCFEVHEFKSQFFFLEFFTGCVDCWLSAHMSHSSASCFAVVSNASSRIA